MPPPSQIPALGAYEALFWKWWRSINPPWRTPSNDGRLIIGDWEEGKAWGPMLFKPGKNGVLSVMYSLDIWRRAIDSVQDRPAKVIGAWDIAVQDVFFALSGTHSELLKGPPPAQTSTSGKKRQRDNVDSSEEIPVHTKRYDFLS